MAPTRKYLDTKKSSVEFNLLTAVWILLIAALVMGALIYANIEIWTAIFE